MIKTPIAAGGFILRCTAGWDEGSVRCGSDQFCLWDSPDRVIVYECAICGAAYNMHQVETAKTQIPVRRD